ncbi:hypothetical protein N0V90_012133 [Kalmusia sp. IMI 367209]|nr:hypothetical protein N0V90_012133 [Kalmusia sp. IMI 367209]
MKTPVHIAAGGTAVVYSTLITGLVSARDASLRKKDLSDGDQAQSSFEECQRTVTPGGICWLPPQFSLPNPAPLPSTLSTAPSSAPISSMSFQTSFPPSKTSSSFLTSISTQQPPSSAIPSSTLSSPPSQTSTGSPPMPTQLTTKKSNVLPIIVPCALAAVGIIGFAIWCALWRSKGQRRPPPPPPPSQATTTSTVDGEKEFKAGNFATAEAFRPGAEEMERKDAEKNGGRWKGVYRKYRKSMKVGSGSVGNAS